jgi:hypothetical protein
MSLNISQSDIGQLAAWFMPRGEHIVATLPTTGVTTGTLLYSSTWRSWAEYDGTRWLGPEILLPWTDIRTLGAYSATATICQAVWPQDYAVYVTKIVTYVNVQTTNNSTNYWTITISSINYNNAGTTLTTIDTSTAASGSALTASTNYRFNTTINTALDNNGTSGTAELLARLAVTKTLSPGNLLMATQILYRPILT